MFKLHYDATSGEIKGFYPSFIEYASIPEPTIEVSEEQQQDCINNQRERRVDLTTLKVVECTVPGPTLEDIKHAKQMVIKGLLEGTDYKCLKFVDGALTVSEYESCKTFRSALRNAYNAVDAATTIEEVEAITINTSST